MYHLHISYYVSYISMNIYNVFGFFLVIAYIMQLISGLLLCCYYNPSVLMSFFSIVYSYIEVIYGYLIKNLHCVWAVIYMFTLFIHLYRGLWLRLLDTDYVYTVYLIGLGLFLLSMLNGFVGYILNYGQMSYWGYMVICGMMTILGVIEWWIMEIIWCSGYVIVNRLFSLHYLVGIVIGFGIFFHIFILHSVSSINPFLATLGVIISFRLVLMKDFMVLYAILFWCFFIIWSKGIEVFGNPDNMIPAIIDITPTNIIPEIYFCAVYAILRGISIKILGMIVSLSILSNVII